MFIAIPNARTPQLDLLTGGQPSEAQLLEAQTAGYQTVINLRGVGEPGTDVEPLILEKVGLAYVHIPINGPADITVEKAKELDAALQTAAGPVVVHCARGNRVGALFALKAFHLQGQSLEDAINVGRASGMTQMEPMVRQLLERAVRP